MAETIKVRPSKSQPNLRPSTSHSAHSPPSILTSSPPRTPPNNIAPPVSVYGTFNPSSSSLSLPKPHLNSKRKSRIRAPSNHSEITVDGACNLDSEQHHLLHQSELAQQSSGVMDEVEGDLIPFRSFFSSLKDAWWGLFRHGSELPIVRSAHCEFLLFTSLIIPEYRPK